MLALELYRGTCGGRVSFHKLKFFESDMFS